MVTNGNQNKYPSPWSSTYLWCRILKVRSSGDNRGARVLYFLLCENQVQCRWNVPPKKLSFRLSFSLSDMTNYKSAFGKVCRIKNRHTFRILPILNSAYFKSMPILNSSYHAVKYAELRIGSILKVCRFVIRHITQTETQTETEANFTHRWNVIFFIDHWNRWKKFGP